MHKNFEKCPHCVAKGYAGTIMRMLETTLLISRSDDKTFHLYLFSGPASWHARSGGVVAGRAASNYIYASDKLKITHGAVTVIFRTTDLDLRGIEKAMRDAADQMAAILSQGKGIEPVLYYDGGSLTVLDPTARP
jgi:hypothetical protein